MPAVSYTVKEKDIYVHDDYMKYYVGVSPSWIFGAGKSDPAKCLGNTEPRVEKSWMLTDRNLLSVLRRHCDDNNLGKIPFRQALKDLFKNSRWRAGTGLRSGIDPLFEHEFDNEDFEEDMVYNLMKRGTLRNPWIGRDPRMPS